MKQVALSTLKGYFLTTVYPVNSIYINTSSTNPATLLGFGTWTAFGAGRVPISANGTYASGATGGSANAINVSHSHTIAHTHTWSDTSSGAGGHSHTVDRISGPGSSSGLDWQTSQELSTDATSSVGDHTHNVSGTTSGSSNANSGSSGSSGTNANLQPWIGVYMWKRTA